jgi:integrase/recombinase XerD
MRTPKKDIVKRIAKILRDERPDYTYLRDLFRKIREEFNIDVTTQSKRLPYVPTEEELRQYYKIVWQTKNIKHMLLIKVLLYTGIRVQELTNIKMTDIDFDRCQIRINKGKGNKDRIVPFPEHFRESLILFTEFEKGKGGTYLFE